MSVSVVTSNRRNKYERFHTLKLSSEEQLLIACAPSSDSQDVTRAAGMIGNGSISWDRLMELAHWHRMTGMLYAFHRDNASIELREDHAAHLREHYTHTSIRTLYIRAEFKRAVQALQAENIDVMALKGVALLDCAYKDSGTREMADIDLLVKPESADRAQEIVQGLGYDPVGTEAVQERTRDNHRHLPKLHDHNRELSFEVHTHIVSSDSPLHFDIDTVWQHAKPATLHGVDVLVPSPEHMLLHLSLHFFLDRRFTSGSSLKQLNDVAGYVGSEQHRIDWDFFLQEVKTYNLGGPVFIVLSTASSLLEVDIPAHVLEELRPNGYSEKMEELFIRQRVLQPKALTATELVPHASVYTLRAMLKGVFRRVAPSNQYMETHYGTDAIDAPASTRMKRSGELFKRGFGYARNPLRLWQEVRVDRWLHSHSRGEALTGNDKHRSG